MRSTSIALRAAGVAAAFVIGPLPGGIAYAGDSVTVTTHPAEVRAGDEVEIRVQGCRGTTGAASSTVFTADAELSGGGSWQPRDPGRSEESEESEGSERSEEGGGGDRAHTLSGSTLVRSHATSGGHDITVTCDGHEHRGAGTLRITGGSHHGDPSPAAPVRAGGGGTAALAVDRERPDEDAEAVGGPSTPHTVVGLILAAGAAVAVALRSSRRRPGRRTGSD
ncbi:hypothetical protein [Streptomyces yaizuensis]|uniref:PT domain-containing protein n=1 Tax=Streptomyces yaizuensis TaxID=2989713 RepID=A0ABQ5NT25_9ACTN|nr:hypothetical protein [Streptomyces sp. YSPA8]GLF93528.1 PT domain-containing protein [Streptomyces sp. YSPA8]